MFLIKSAFAGKKALYLSKCPVKQQLKFFNFVTYIWKCEVVSYTALNEGHQLGHKEHMNQNHGVKWT